MPPDEEPLGGGDAVARRWARASLILCAASAAFVGVFFNRIVEDRLGSAAANDVRSVGAGLSAVGLLTFGVRLAVVGAMAADGADRIRIASRSRAWLISVGLGLPLATGVAAFSFIGAGAGYKLQVAACVAISVAAIVASVVPLAEMLYAEQWVRMGLLMLLGPLVRVGAGALMLPAAQPALNLAPIVLAEVALAAAAYAARPDGQRVTDRATDRAPIWNGCIASLGLLVSVGLGSVALRSRLGADADVFNESAALARVVAFLPLSVSLLNYPRMAKHPLGARDLRRAYHSALLWTLLLAGLACAAILVAPSAVADLVDPDGELASPATARVLAAASLMFSLGIVSLFLYIAHGSRLAFSSWGAAAIVGIGQLTTSTPMQLAVVVLVASLVLLVAVSVPALLRVQPVLRPMSFRPHPVGHATRRELTVVIPCYNPGPAVLTTIAETRRALADLGVACTVIAVSDGSTDGSDDLLDGIASESVRHIRHPRNRGKGAAVRTGFAAAETDLVAFIDADGDLSPSLLGSLLLAQEEFDADIVFGSKSHTESVVHASSLRRAYSAGYQRMIKLLFQLDIRDTQTGIKLFRRRTIATIMPALQEEAFALDLELFIAARAAGFHRFVEVPVVLRREAGSTIRFSSVLRMFSDTLRLFWRAKVSLQYNRSATVDTASPDRARTTA